jgi:hypothetical protein
MLRYIFSKQVQLGLISVEPGRPGLLSLNFGHFRSFWVQVQFFWKKGPGLIGLAPI